MCSYVLFLRLGNEGEIYLQLLASFLASRTKNGYDNQWIGPFSIELVFFHCCIFRSSFFMLLITNWSPRFRLVLSMPFGSVIRPDRIDTRVIHGARSAREAPYQSLRFSCLRQYLEPSFTEIIASLSTLYSYLFVEELWCLLANIDYQNCL